MVTESRIHPTYDGTETVLSGFVGKFVDEFSARWHGKSRPIFKGQSEQSKKITKTKTVQSDYHHSKDHLAKNNKPHLLVIEIKLRL